MPLRNGSSGYTTGMLSKVNGDSPEKCRRKRCRRIRIRRLQAKVLRSATTSSSLSFQRRSLLYNISEALGIGRGVEMTDPSSTSTEPSTAASHIPASGPVVGVISITGRRRAMEDTTSIKPNLCSPEINNRRPVDFFAIYDGHGGRHVAALCSERMHVLLQEELARVGDNINTDMSGSSRSGTQQLEEQRTEEAWKSVLRSCFLRIDEMASTTCGECGSVGYQCGCPRDTLGLVGSTAVVAVLTEETIIVANCGDSRAVLSRGGKHIPLSSDHKPDKRDERARIEASGGRVVFANGPRVQGILAMSRAIGDKYLKPYVISEPEITFTKREAEDDCLILASDGLWDVISNEMACEVASECLREEYPAEDHSFSPLVEGDNGGAIYSSRSASAAALLTRLALGRKSCDNISVIVVDLKRSHTGG
ncbi:putative protein phosphatase 2C 75 [Nicotiana tabacum]|uniref:protein-serine/threonine phosphatase n=1 Tax=Nicotiana tabacum TaxID=4097 RepID=A0A1S3WY63_TOBAC|nr:PREDICTED: probable protein phosphatase 2C 75 [Nicotiana tabacum]